MLTKELMGQLFRAEMTGNLGAAPVQQTKISKQRSAVDTARATANANLPHR
jgi:hypothetical protein